MSNRHPGSRFHAALNRRRWQHVRLQVLGRDNWRCQNCGRYGREVDHVTPLEQGGAAYDLANLQTLCGGRGGCHARKTAGERRRPRTPQGAAWDALVKELMAVW